MHHSLEVFSVILRRFIYLLPLPVSQLGVMTYSDMTAQSPDTQAAVEHEVRVLLKVCVIFFFFFRTAKQKTTLVKPFPNHLFSCGLQESYERAKVLLKSHAKEHKNLADALLMYETLDAKEIQLVLEGKALETR